jgi:hypothetical protein
MLEEQTREKPVLGYATRGTENHRILFGDVVVGTFSALFAILLAILAVMFAGAAVSGLIAHATIDDPIGGVLGCGLVSFLMAMGAIVFFGFSWETFRIGEKD